MEKIDQVDTEEIFEECDNMFIANDELKNKESISGTNRDYDKFPTEEHEQESHNDFANYKQTNNNHHVVHVGIIIVLLTIYLGMTNVQKCLVSCVENTSTNELNQQQKEKFLNYLQNPKILERFLEYKDICKDLHIFTKAVEQNGQEKEPKQENHESDDNMDNVNDNLIDIGSGSGRNEEGSSTEYEDGSGASDNGDCAKINRKHKKSKHSIKTNNAKNGFNKYNKSTKAKYQKTEKKDLNLNKKNSTAEPIIYLFALVFIYLLLKAASDINQHYKSQSKNDKRLRRCSLQSYAQTHRPDRRASKELALKQKQQQQQQQQRLKSLLRSSSQDQQNYHYSHHENKQQYLIDVSPQKSSEQKQQSTIGTSTSAKVSYATNWQLLRQHTTTQSLDNSDILHSTRGNTEISSSLMGRRCSVPAALSYQRQKISTVSPLNIINDHANLNCSLSRRASIVLTPLPLVVDTNDSLVPETKRRVRMINRH